MMIMDPWQREKLRRLAIRDDLSPAERVEFDSLLRRWNAEDVLLAAHAGPPDAGLLLPRGGEPTPNDAAW